MSMQSECIEEFIRKAQEDQAVYITDVRRSFDKTGTLAFHVHVHMYEDETEVFSGVKEMTVSDLTTTSTWFTTADANLNAPVNQLRPRIERIVAFFRP